MGEVATKHLGRCRD